jgi:hypothetical protein
MGRITRRILIAAVAVFTLGVVNVSPASAGDAARNCVTYYYHANPASGWGFTSCVKLVHDPTNHEWGSIASVSTTTPGMVLHTATVGFDMYFPNNNFILHRQNVDGPAASLIDNIKSPFVTCSGLLLFRGDVSEFVTWPDGETSSTTDTFTIGDNAPANSGARWAGTC